MATSKAELHKIERAVVKLRNKMNRSDLDYTVQISVSSIEPTKLKYAAQVTPPANGLAPVTFIEESASELVKKIKEATEHIDTDEIEKAYHKSQIISAKKTIEGHEDAIKEIEQKQKEEKEGKTADTESETKEEGDAEEQEQADSSEENNNDK